MTETVPYAVYAVVTGFSCSTIIVVRCVFSTLTHGFLEFHFDLSIVFLRVYPYIAFVVVVLDITLHILLWATGVGILPASVKCRNLTCLHIPLCSSISSCLNYFLYLYWEHQIVL